MCSIALRNAQHCKTGISYPTAAEWRLRSRGLFAEVHWAERHFVEATAHTSSVSRTALPLVSHRVGEWLYRGLHTRVLVLRA